MGLDFLPLFQHLGVAVVLDDGFEVIRGGTCVFRVCSWIVHV